MSLPVLNRLGFWYANTNTPSLADGVGTLGDCYQIVTATEFTVVPGTGYFMWNRNLGSGTKTWISGSYIYYDGTEWQMIGGVTGSGIIPNLQQVTDVGSITTNKITVGSLSGLFSQVLTSAIITENANTGTYAYLDSSGYLGLNNGVVESYLYNTNVTNTGIALQFPNATASTNYTIPISVNGITANSAGDITISAGGGTVTSIATAGLISGGPITATGTITTSMSTNKLVGRSTAGTGIMEEITIGSGLTLSGGTLSNTATPTAVGYYGAWQDNVTQTAATNNTGYAMIYRTVDLSNGVTVVTDGSNLTRITFANTGIYNIQFSAQLQNLSTATEDVTIWLRKNGVDLPATGTIVGLAQRKSAGDPYHTVASWNFVLSVVGGEYYQLMWSTTNHTDVTIPAYSAISPAPSVPSIILTVTQQSGIMAGTGITAINSLTGAVQTMVTGTTGTDFGISSSGTTHTFNLPSASATNRGALSSADWTTFNSKQASGNYITALTGDVTASGPGSVAATIATNAVTYAKMQAVSATSKLLGSSSTTTPVQEIILGTGISMSGNTLSATGSGGSLGITLSGGGGVISTGSKGYLRMPRAGTIISWTLVGDQASGSIIIDVKRSTYSGFPTTTSIAGADLPTITSAQKATDSTLTGWGSTALASGDIIEFVVNSCTAFTFVTLSISYT